MSNKKSIVSTSIATSNNNGNNKATTTKWNCCSQTSLLNIKIDFKSEKEFEKDEKEDFPTSIEKLKKKYHVLTANVQVNRNFKSVNGYTTDNKSPQKASNGADNNENEENNGNEIERPKRILYPPENIELEWKKISKIGAGLDNLGNTCFLNSVLQCLTYCPPLVNFLNSSRDSHVAKCRLQFCIVCIVRKHIDCALSSSLVRPINIFQRLRSIAKFFQFGRQEDAHEFLRYLLDNMRKVCLYVHELELGIPGSVSRADIRTKETNAINQIFGGYLRSQVLCSICKVKSNTYEVFMDFMLDIQNISSLQEALKNFVSPEFLRNDNAYKCLKCKKPVVAKKQITVHRAPNVATFQFKRFNSHRNIVKIVKAVSFPEFLDLRPYMSETGPPVKYKLISVLVHIGASCESGHYVCYVRNSNNCWYLMNDSQVIQVGLDQVLRQKAYILLYVRQLPPNSNKQAISLKTIASDGNKKNLEEGKISLPKNDFKILNSKFALNSVYNSNSAHKQSNENGHIKNFQNHKVQDNNRIVPSNIKPKGILKSQNGQNDSCKSSTDSNGLVPYDQNKSDEEKTSNHSNSENKTQIKNSDKDGDSSNKINSNKGRLLVPAIKVKATTDSWKVVETVESDTRSSSDQEQKSILKWKIIKTSSFEQDGQSLSSNKDKSKKKRKKQKSKKRKRSDDEESDVEFDWIERTKETLELEMKNDIRVPDETANPNKRLKSPENKNSTSRPTSNLVEVLNGYDQVKTWGGGESSLYETNKIQKSFDDEYNEEFDRGKTNKIKSKMEKFKHMPHQSSAATNPFQELQQAKYNGNHNGYQNGNETRQQNNYNQYHVNGSYKKMKFQHDSFNHRSGKYNSNKSSNKIGSPASSYYHHNSNHYHHSDSNFKSR